MAAIGKRSSKRWVVGVLTGLVAVTAGSVAAYATLKAYLASLVEQRLSDSLRTAGLSVDTRSVEVRVPHQVLVRYVHIQRKGLLQVEANQVALRLDLWGAILGYSPVESLEVERLHVLVGTPERPLRPASLLRDLVKALSGVASAEGGSRPRGPRLQRPPSLPSIAVRRVSGSVFVQPNSAQVQAITIQDGEIHTEPRATGLTRTGTRLLGQVRLISGTGNDYTVRPLVDIGIGGEVEASSIDFSPSVSLTVGNDNVTVSGVSWQKASRALKLLGVQLGLGSLRMSAKTVLLRTAGGAATAESFSGHDELWGMLEVVEVEDATIGLNVRGALGLLMQGEKRVLGPAESARRLSHNATARFLKESFAWVKAVISRVLDLTRGLGRALVAHRIAVRNARVVFEGEPHDMGLANLNFSMKGDQGGGKDAVRIRVSFEAPETSGRRNVMELTMDPARKWVVGTAEMERLVLWPYRGFMPKGIILRRDTALQGTRLEVRLSRDVFAVSGTLGWRDLVLDLPPIAAEPIYMPGFKVSGAMEVDFRDRGSLEVREAGLTIGDIHIPFEVRVTGLGSKDLPELRVKAWVKRIRGEDLVASLPAAMIDSLKRLRLSGSFRASFSLEVDMDHMEGLRVRFKPDVSDLVVLDPGEGVNLDALQREFYHVIEKKGGKVVRRYLGPDSPDYVTLDKVPRHLIDALTTSEDARFFEHKGFSLVGIRRAIEFNLERGGFYQGASTLSQQLVKNLFLSREKTLARKLQEAFITWQVEQFLTKERILELYLNVVQWGENVYGLTEAAMHYFGKKPEELDPLESAFLVAILPNPSKYGSRFYEAGRVPKRFEAKVKWLLKEMVVRGLLPDDVYEEYESRHIGFAGKGPPAHEGSAVSPLQSPEEQDAAEFQGD